MFVKNMNDIRSLDMHITSLAADINLVQNFLEKHR
jgi:hypothetical protein